jgi:hypothetical protein
MAEYDASLDVLMKHIGIVKGTDPKSLSITVDLKQWADGPVRIRVNRVGKKKKDKENYTTKLGSMSADEAMAVAVLLVKAAEALYSIQTASKK